jgi:hypothetical protein
MTPARSHRQIRTSGHTYDPHTDHSVRRGRRQVCPSLMLAGARYRLLAGCGSRCRVRYLADSRKSSGPAIKQWPAHVNRPEWITAMSRTRSRRIPAIALVRTMVICC